MVLGVSCGFLGRPGACCGFLGRPGWISWGLLGCPGASTGESCGFLGPLARFWVPPAGFWRFSTACCCFLGPPAVFAASCVLLTLPRAGLLVGLLRVSEASCGFLGPARIPAASYGFLGPPSWSGFLAGRKFQNAALSWNSTDSQSVVQQE